MRDERVYSDPEAFRPERFLPLVGQTSNNYQRSLDEVSAGDPGSLVYGFGRRLVHRAFYINLVCNADRTALEFALDAT